MQLVEVFMSPLSDFSPLHRSSLRVAKVVVAVVIKTHALRVMHLFCLGVVLVGACIAQLSFGMQRQRRGEALFFP